MFPKTTRLFKGSSCLSRSLRFSTLKPRIVIHKEVSEALLKNKPVVALESTIITHGMPFPHNLKYVELRNYSHVFCILNLLDIDRGNNA